jgi:hypothetical protein
MRVFPCANFIKRSQGVVMETFSVTVYSFEVVEQAGICHMPFKATREAIESRHGGKIIDGTDEVVPASWLDGDGRYRRWPTGWTLEQLQHIH